MNNSKNRNTLDECVTCKKIIIHLHLFMATFMIGKSILRIEFKISDKLIIFFVHLSDRLMENARDI